MQDSAHFTSWGGSQHSSRFCEPYVNNNLFSLDLQEAVTFPLIGEDSRGGQEDGPDFMAGMDHQSSAGFGSLPMWGMGMGMGISNLMDLSQPKPASQQSLQGKAAEAAQRAQSVLATHGITQQSLVHSTLVSQPAEHLMSLNLSQRRNILNGVSQVMQSARPMRPQCPNVTESAGVDPKARLIPFESLLGILSDTLHTLEKDPSQPKELPQAEVMRSAAITHAAFRAWLREHDALPEVKTIKELGKRPRWSWEQEDKEVTFVPGKQFDNMMRQVKLLRSRMERFYKHHGQAAEDKNPLFVRFKDAREGRQVWTPKLKLPGALSETNKLPDDVATHVLMVVHELCMLKTKHRVTNDKTGRSFKALNRVTDGVHPHEVVRSISSRFDLCLGTGGARDVKRVMDVHCKENKLVKHSDGTYIVNPDAFGSVRLAGDAESKEKDVRDMRRKRYRAACDDWVEANLDRLTDAEKDEIQDSVNRIVPDTFECSGAWDCSKELCDYSLQMVKERLNGTGEEGVVYSHDELVSCLETFFEKVWSGGKHIKTPMDDAKALWESYQLAHPVASACTSDLRLHPNMRLRLTEWSGVEELRKAVVMTRIVSLIELHHTRTALFVELCKTRMAQVYAKDNGTEDDAAARADE